MYVNKSPCLLLEACSHMLLCVEEDGCLHIFAWMTLCSEGVWKVLTCFETNGRGANGCIDCFSIGEPAALQIRCFQQLYLSSKRRALSGWRSLNNTSHQFDPIWASCRWCGGPQCLAQYLQTHRGNISGKGSRHFSPLWDESILLFIYFFTKGLCVLLVN